jgi:methyltransferase (TIGR00027 family)
MSPSTSRLESLAQTAWWTAAARACESRRGDRLFDDPWAGLLAGRRMVEQFEAALQGSGTADLQAVITRFFDEFALRGIRENGARQVVLVASGLDARAFRLSWPPQTRLFELEQPSLTAYKNQRLALIDAKPRCERVTVGVDLDKPWADALLRAGFDPLKRSIWILESFLYFLSEPSARRLLSTVSQLTVPGSQLGTDLVNASMVNSPATRHWSERMAAAGSPWLFTTDEPEQLLWEFSWLARVSQPGEEGARFGRCPFPITARDVPEKPRSFLVTATRQ